MNLYDLMTAEDLDAAQSQGLIRFQEHPRLPLHIWNYTDKAVYTPGAWGNPAVRLCRGLIVDAITQEVVARPWAKFFNHNQAEAGLMDLDAPVEVTDKMDGSLGILYPWRSGGDFGYAIATRGSFDSDQARVGTALWRNKYAGSRWVPVPAWTFLFEIVYPKNRIVLDYGDMTDLILLGAVNIGTGEARGPLAWDWPGPKAEVFPYPTLGDALAAPPRPNAEGLVVRYTNQIQRLLKIKQQDYVELHRIVTGLNDRVIWEHGYEEGALDELLARLPDELHPYTRGVHTELLGMLSLTALRAQQAFARIMPQPSRKEFAEQALKSEHRALLFMLLDGKDILPAIWKTLRPRGDRKPFARSEDVA